MGKTTNRVLSLVLTVLMVLSMVSVFVLPASAADTATDYDALLTGDNTFIIDNTWRDSELKAGETLDFTFRGEVHELDYVEGKFFNSYADAFETIWSGLTAANYFTYNPTIVFGPGEYEELIHTPATCTILGTNAGISPNATISDEDWNTEYIGNNSGWPANSARPANETIFTSQILVTTRGGDSWDQMPASGDGAKWAYLKEKGFALNSKGVTTTVVDGIKSTASELVSFSGYDVNTAFEYNGEALKAGSGRQILARIQNTVATNSKALASAWNTNNDYFHVEYDNIRSNGALSTFLQRYIDSATFTNSYITGFTGRITGNNSDSFMLCAKHGDISLTFEKSVIHNGPSGNVWAFYGDPNTNGYSLTLKDNLLYNVSGGNYGVFRIDSTKGFDSYYNITGNEIYHDLTKNTFFNGNPNYITSGRVYINMNNNRLISPTLASFLPNSQYDAAEAGSILFYNFDSNFWSTSKDAEGKKIAFQAGPNGGAALASGWDYNDPNYFYDYNMTYSSHGTKIVGGDMGEGNTIEIKDNNIISKITNPDEIITPKFTMDPNAGASAEVKVQLATDLGFTNVIEAIDPATIDGTATYYVRAYYEGTAYEHIYKMTVISAIPVDFNDDFMANGMKFAGYDLEYKNTAVYVNETVTEADGEYAYAFLGDVYYRFKVDDELVFDNMNKLALLMESVEDPYVIVPAGDYGDMEFTYAATYLGANAGIDPVDDTVSVKADGSDWAVGKNWGLYGETEFRVMSVPDGLEGKLAFDGITMRGQFNDTYRTMGKDGVAYGGLDIEFKNTVVDQNKDISFTDSRSAYVKAISLGGSGSQYLFNLINARGVNYNNTQQEDNGQGGTALVEYPGFGDTYEDSFTIKSMYIKDQSETIRFMNEYGPAHTTFDNIYRDATAAESVTILSWLKTGAANKNNSFTMVNCNFRNGTTNNSDHMLMGIEGPTRNNTSTKIAAGYKNDIVISNNIFYNANREKANMKIITVEAAYVSSLEVNNNFVYADDELSKTNIFLGNNSSYAASATDNDLVVLGNIEVSGNSFIGFGAESSLLSIGMGANSPALTDAFVTEDTLTYTTNKSAGIYNAAMGNAPYWLDYDRTISSDSFQVKALEPKTDKIVGYYLDQTNKEFGFTVTEGKLSDVGIVLPEGATGTWYADEACTEPFEDKTVEEIGYNAEYYYVVVNGENSTKYFVPVYTVEFIDFTDAENLDPEYFSNKAVIVTEKAAGLAAGSIVIEEWDGVKYRFYAGVNAFDTYAGALASSAMPEILVPKATQANGVLNSNLDLLISKSMKLYTPNYNVNPVKTDGFGVNSPSQGKNWGYNTEFDKHKDDVHIKSISTWTTEANPTIEIYGLTMDNALNDNGRQVGSTISFKLVNLLNTRAKSGGYLFNFGTDNAKSQKLDYTLATQKNSLYVKNAYFAAEPADKTASTARLMGELIPAHVTFDTIYLDHRLANFAYPAYIKNTASDSSITFKNSYLSNSVDRNDGAVYEADGKTVKQWDTDPINMVFQGYSYDANSDGLFNDNQAQPIKEGYSNKLIFDNNIMDNFATYARYKTSSGSDSGSAAMLYVAGQSFSEISITNNYIAAPRYMYISAQNTSYEIKSYDLMWSSGGWADIASAEGVYRVTGNILNGLSSGNTTYGVNSQRAVNFTHYVYDNFRTSSRVTDITDYAIEGEAMAWDGSKPIGTGKSYDKVVGETYYRLTADGEYLSNEVNPYTFADKVAVTDGKATVSSYEGELFNAVEGGYEFDLSSLIANNFYKNRFTVAYGDGAAVDMATGKVTVTADAFAEAGFDFTVTVDSIQGNAENKEVYTFTVTNAGAAPAFVGNYNNDTISDNAIIITAKANGTDSIVELWDGGAYTFVSGTNAFATVADALNYAKTNSLTDVQLLLVNSTKETDITITYPCTIYGANYDVEPHTTDGNGPDSPTHGDGWNTNVEYLAKQTHVRKITLAEGFPSGGTFEAYGLTMHNAYEDKRTTQNNVAKVKLQNILLDIDGISHSSSQKYMFNLNNNANYYTSGNSFEFKNVNFYRVNTNSVNLSWFYGEWGPETTILDNIFVDDAAGLNFMDSTAYIKNGLTANGKGVMILRNSYINASSENIQYHLSFEGNKDAATYSGGVITKNDTNSKGRFVFDNNIFRNFRSRKTVGDTCFINTHATGVQELTFTGNYFDYGDSRIQNTLNALSYNGSATKESAADPMITCQYTVKDNVFNGFTLQNVNFTPSGRYHSNTKITVQNNYRVAEYIPNLYAGNDPIGLATAVYSKNTASGSVYYALNYARNAYNTTVGAPTYEMLDNLIVESDDSVNYAPDATLSVTEGKINGTVDHIIASYPAYNNIKLVVDGVEADIDATITDAAAIAIRLYAQDGVTYKDFAVNLTTESAHNFTDYEVVVPATCLVEAIEKAICDGTCGDADCTAYTTRTVSGSKTEHIPGSAGVPNGDATCQTNGTMTVTCKTPGCGEKFVVEQPNSTVSHQFANDAYVAHEPATCDAPGKEIAKCTWCDETNIRVNSEKYPVDKSLHIWGEWVNNNDATCAKDGTETRTCEGCGETETQTDAENLKGTVAHTWGTYTYNGDATCEKDGTMTARCTVENCRAKNTIKDPDFPAEKASHTWGEWTSNNDATCCKDGTESAKCTVCGDKTTRTDKGSVLGHNDTSKQFKDVKKGAWYKTAVDYVVTHGYISGMSTTEFGIGTPVTRGMFITILARIAGVDTNKNNVKTIFTDVESGKYYTAAIKWANENDIVSGMSATTFAPNANITRQQLAVMIANFAEAQGITLTAKNAAIKFADAGSIATWAKDAVAACQKAGIISGYSENGKTTFKPNNTATRAEAAQMIYKFTSEFVNK